MFYGVDGRILWAVQLMFYALVGAAILMFGSDANRNYIDGIRFAWRI